MRNKIVLSSTMMGISFFLILGFYFLGYSQSKNAFVIEGDVKGLRAGSKLCLIIKKGNRIDTISRSVAKTGFFVFKDVRLPSHPDFYLIAIQTEFVENLKLFLDQSGDVKIAGDLEKWPDVKVSGSKTNDDFVTARRIRKKVWDDGFVTKYPDGMAPSADTGLFYSKKGMLAVVNQMPNSYYIPAMIAMWVHPASESGYVVDADVKKPFYDQLTKNVKESYYGKILAKQLTDYAESKKWIRQLEKNTVGLKSILRDEVMKQMVEAENDRVSVVTLPISTKHLDKTDLKTKGATLIVGMAYHKLGDSITKVNPTSAYVIDESGICVTNYHVGKEYSNNSLYKSLSVTTLLGKTYPVTKILSCSESDDLMIFQVDTKGDKLSALPIGNTAPEGSKIHVMGHPLGKFYQFTSGKVSGYSTSTLAGKSCNIMSITADFNVGSSGGPIVDDYGNVVGTVSRIDGGMKVGVPVSELKKLLILK